MSFLAPVFNVTYSVTHDFLTGKLSVRAEGEISDQLNDPFFERDQTWLGGYKFNLLTTRKPDPSTPVQRHFVARPNSETIYLPPYITTILVETASGIVEAAINFIQLAPSTIGSEGLTSKINSLKISESGKALNSSGVVVDVLPPKDIYLPGGVTTRINATISKPEIGLWPRISVNSKFDSEVLELVDAEAAVGSGDQNGITYSVRWKTMADVPSVFRVITTTWNGELGPEAVTSRVIQPYIIHFVVWGAANGGAVGVNDGEKKE